MQSPQAPWSPWLIVGFSANAFFFSRFIIQWWATERKKQVVIPAVFWWLSLAGTLLLLSYSIFYKRDAVFIMANCVAWIPYCRNLIIHYTHHSRRKQCGECGVWAAPDARFCSSCGTILDDGPEGLPTPQASK